MLTYFFLLEKDIEPDEPSQVQVPSTGSEQGMVHGLI